MNMDVSKVAAMIRALPDLELVRLARLLIDDAPPPVATPQGRVARSRAAEGDVDAIAGVLHAAGQPLSVRDILARMSAPDWREPGWDAPRVRRGLIAAIDRGVVRQVGAKKGARYMLAPTLGGDPTAPADVRVTVEGPSVGDEPEDG